jgi:hemolysin III
MLKNMKAEKPLLRGHSHQAMFFVALGACSVLVFKCRGVTETIATLVYSMGLLTMFGISALYHRVHWEPQKRLFMKKLDHCAIYIMIAGTFTPICLLSLSESSGRQLLLLIWSVALLGILQSIFFVNLPKLASAILYLIAGYLVLPYLSELEANLGQTNIALILGGGLAYSIGALTYGLKKPVLNPRVFGYHEVFHALVCVAAILHFCVVYSIVDRHH